MRIYFNTSTRLYKKLIKEVNKYWNTLSYDKVNWNKKNFYNDDYNFYIDRHSIHIWKEKNPLTKKQIDEIRTMLLIIFKDDIIGSVNISRNEEDNIELIEMVKTIKNLKFFNLLHTKTEYSKEELTKCYDLINNIEKKPENENELYIIKSVLTNLIASKL